MREICAKCALGRHLNDMQSLLPSEYDFHPPTFVLPYDRRRLELFWEAVSDARARREKEQQRRLKRRPGKPRSPSPSPSPPPPPSFPSFFDLADVSALIAKPDTDCQGRGIRLACDPTSLLRPPSQESSGDESGGGGGGPRVVEGHLPGRQLVQAYIPNPLLLNGHKFDLRIYVVVTSVYPTIRAFIHRDGLARFATRRYVAPQRSNLKKKRIHLTNYAVNKGRRMESDAAAAGAGRGGRGEEEEEEEEEGASMPSPSIPDSDGDTAEQEEDEEEEGEEEGVGIGRGRSRTGLGSRVRRPPPSLPSVPSSRSRPPLPPRTHSKAGLRPPTLPAVTAAPTTDTEEEEEEEEEEGDDTPTPSTPSDAGVDGIDLDAVFLERDHTSSKWSLRALWLELAEQGIDVDAVWKSIRELAAKTLLSVAPGLAHEYTASVPGAGVARAGEMRFARRRRRQERKERKEREGKEREEEKKKGDATDDEAAGGGGGAGGIGGGIGDGGGEEDEGGKVGEQGFHCFELLGLDVILTEKTGLDGRREVKAVLLEVNQLPSLNIDTPVDVAVKHRVITDTLRMIAPDQNWLVQQGPRRLSRLLPHHPPFPPLEHGRTSSVISPAASTFLHLRAWWEEYQLSLRETGLERLLPAVAEEEDARWRRILESVPPPGPKVSAAAQRRQEEGRQRRKEIARRRREKNALPGEVIDDDSDVSSDEAASRGDETPTAALETPPEKVSAEESAMRARRARQRAAEVAATAKAAEEERARRKMRHQARWSQRQMQRRKEKQRVQMVMGGEGEEGERGGEERGRRGGERVPVPTVTLGMGDWF